MTFRYIVTLEATNLYAEIWINNLPIGTIDPTENSPFTFPVNEYVLEGTNRIGIMLHTGPTPSSSGAPWNTSPKAQSYKGPSRMALKLAKYAEQELPFRDHPPVLASIDWQGNALPLPSYQERQVTLPRVSDPPPWTTARIFSVVNAQLRTSAIEYLRSLYALLEGHHLQAFVDATAPRIEWGSKAYGVPASSMKQQLMAMLEEASKPPFHLLPFDASTIDLRLVGDGRLLDCNRIDREPIFQYKQTASVADVFFFPIKIGQRDGKWMILS